MGHQWGQYGIIFIILKKTYVKDLQEMFISHFCNTAFCSVHWCIKVSTLTWQPMLTIFKALKSAVRWMDTHRPLKINWTEQIIPFSLCKNKHVNDLVDKIRWVRKDKHCLPITITPNKTILLIRASECTHSLKSNHCMTFDKFISISIPHRSTFEFGGWISREKIGRFAPRDNSLY